MPKNNKMRVAGCIMEYNNKFLILYRKPNKPNGDTWGLPAGKVDNGETDEQAIVREIYEETGYKANLDELELLGEFRFNFPDYIVDFPTFRIKLKQQFNVAHKPDEHEDYKWVTKEECNALPNLIYGFRELLEKIGYGV